MKSVSLFALLFTLMSCTEQKPVQNEVDHQTISTEVNAAFESLVRASKALNAEDYFSHFDEQAFVGLNSDGTNWNSLEDLKALAIPGFNATERIQSLEFPNVKISVIDDNTAVLVNEYQQTLTLKNGTELQVAGGGTQVWSKRSGTWKLMSVSASNKTQ